MPACCGSASLSRMPESRVPGGAQRDSIYFTNLGIACSRCSRKKDFAPRTTLCTASSPSGFAVGSMGKQRHSTDRSSRSVSRESNRKRRSRQVRLPLATVFGDRNGDYSATTKSATTSRTRHPTRQSSGSTGRPAESDYGHNPASRAQQQHIGTTDSANTLIRTGPEGAVEVASGKCHKEVHLPVRSPRASPGSVP